MPEVGKTPIQHYRTSTAAAVPLAGNMVDGEIAINRADNKIFAKNSAGTVVELAGTTNLGTAVVTTNSRSITSSTGDDITVPVVTTTVAGFMSHTDKSKLDLVADNANNYSLPEATTTVRGGIELFSDTDQSVAANAVTTIVSRTYGLQLNSDGQGVVNVPWVGTDAVEAPTASTIPLRTATGSLKVANAAATNEAVALGQGDGRYQARNTFEISGCTNTVQTVAAGQTVVLAYFPLKTPSDYRWRIRGMRAYHGDGGAFQKNLFHDETTILNNTQLEAVNGLDNGPNELGAYATNIFLNAAVSTTAVQYSLSNATGGPLTLGISSVWMLLVLESD